MGILGKVGWLGEGAREEDRDEVLLGDPYLRFEGAAEPDPDQVTRMPSRWRTWLSAFGLGWVCGREAAKRK